METLLWPARNVAEFAYCPRLFYFMEVEGIHVPSDDTEAGQRIHRRVDAPSHSPEDCLAHDAETGQPRSLRSLTLTSNRLGLTATLDVAEIDGRIAVPVEYRKGRPQRSRHTPCDEPNASPDSEESADEQSDLADASPWPTDRVQVGLQVLLLEEAGYTVPRAELYYAAEKRRLVVPVDDQLRQDALDTLAAAKSCATGSRPLPLVNDPKCPRCSLQPICLPDEINLERADVANGGRQPPGDEPARTPRKLWPPRDDGIHLVAQKRGTHVGVRGSMMRLSDDNGATIQNVPLANVESLSLLGSVQISTQAMQTLADRGIPVALLSAAGNAVKYFATIRTGVYVNWRT